MADETVVPPHTAQVIRWSYKEQREDGSFVLAMLRTGGNRRLPCWLGLAICRALGRFTAADNTRCGSGKAAC